VFGSGKKKVAGCLVDEGKLQKGAQMEVTRGKDVVFTGKVASLRRIKDSVEEVRIAFAVICWKSCVLCSTLQ
jgi:translation initiation factor IF-2